MSSTIPCEVPLSILIVDDWCQLETFLRRDLAFRVGLVQVKQLHDILGAMEAIETIHPAIVLLDQRLPSGSGLDLIQPIKQMFPNTIVIMFTGNPGKTIETQSRQLGVDHYFRKGAGYENLMCTLALLIAERRKV